MITSEDRKHFHEHGWVVPKWRLPADRLLALQDLVETALECRGDKRNYLPDFQRYAPDVLSFANAADVLDMVQVFTGPDIAI